MDRLTSSSEEPLASHSALPDSEEAWLTTVATWPLSSVDLLGANGLAGSSGKTSPASCHQTEEGILVPSSGAWRKSGMGSPTAFLTLNTLEFPSDAAVCSLSDILETGDLPQRFFLSATACRGILRRAEKRGKTLPTRLLHALQVVADGLNEPETPEDKTLL